MEETMCLKKSFFKPSRVFWPRAHFLWRESLISLCHKEENSMINVSAIFWKFSCDFFSAFLQEWRFKRIIQNESRISIFFSNFKNLRVRIQNIFLSVKNTNNWLASIEYARRLLNIQVKQTIWIYFFWFLSRIQTTGIFPTIEHLNYLISYWEGIVIWI